MQLNARHIQVITLVILFTILGGQAIWIYNLYEAQHRLITQVKDEALLTAILQEHRYRHETMGGTIVSNPRFHEGDTSRYITKTITLIDTSFQVQFDRYDPYGDVKLSQFILKDHLPINITMLDSIFKKELSNRGVKEASTYIEYIDLKNDEVLQHSKPDKTTAEYTASELVIIDIFNTLGVKGYIQISSTAILMTMAIQLVLTALLILICSFFLTIIIRTFFIREKTEKMRQDSVNTMTHEFKRPLSVAVSKMALIPYYLQKGNTDRVQHYAEQSLLELQKLNTYTERIQKLSNNERETIKLHKEHIDIEDFFTSFVKKYEAVEEKTVVINLLMNTSQTNVYADLLHFANIMDNLIENAIKYSREDGVQIDIRVSDERNKLRISVKDNGLGIAEKDIPRIFQKFYRSEDKSIRHKTGFGLGLTYVKALIEAHAAEIKVESKLGIETKFTVYFPIQNDAE
ncbi:HAMP domain-containing histidine kinase [Sphingobacterium sp. DN00404]|uniref:histidine kinase n=1 Tax=Sphingobacterium micropteri TaxID=2763501 RepID=A0ABR7YNG8_9SPHI|nr:HAMP domain-containing sensor histidine kinase [Sphingobacterium micropteri]MBD1432862.1 HAMP domain-containing histidine kinase [Sphingobacterium micropteri]